MSWYSVHVATAPSSAADERDIPEAVVDDFVELLSKHHGVTGAGRRGWSATVSVEADTATTAGQHGHQLVRDLAAKVGLPSWPTVRLEAVDEDVLEAEQQITPMPELVGASEVADILGVTRQRVHQLNENSRRTRDFPHPLVQVRMGPLWDARAIRVFSDRWARRPGRPRTRRAAELSDPHATVSSTVTTGRQAAIRKEPAMATGDIHTSKQGDRWVNKAEGNTNASNSAPTKADAQATGRQMAIDRGVEHVIHNQDGQIGERNTYPRSRDPKRSKG